MSATANGQQLPDLLALMARLRDKSDGCEWCREQTFESISAYTIEEAFEVADAIASGCRPALCDELGDLLLQVVFHARMAEEEGSFNFDDVVDAISRKLVRRHPQIFAGDEGFRANATDWERIKREERAQQGEVRNSLMDGVPAGLPALARATKLQQKAALAGFDWPDAKGALAKLHEEIAELEQAMAQGQAEAVIDELGDVLFTLVNLSRHLAGGINAGQSLRRATHKFERRFRAMEQASATPLADLPAPELERLWQEAKWLEEGGA